MLEASKFTETIMVHIIRKGALGKAFLYLNKVSFLLLQQSLLFATANKQINKQTNKHANKNSSGNQNLLMLSMPSVLHKSFSPHPQAEERMASIHTIILSAKSSLS